MLDDVKQWFIETWDKFWETIQSLFDWLFGKILDALIAMLSAIPVPDFIQNAGSAIQQSFGYMTWGAGMLELEFGMAVCFGAYLLRFMIRRLPIVG